LGKLCMYCYAVLLYAYKVLVETFVHGA